MLLADDREAAVATYEAFPGTAALRFETKVTVINRARGLPPERRHPVATLQLRGKNLVEIDQLDGLAERPLSARGLPAGIAMISFAVAAIPDGVGDCETPRGHFSGRHTALLRGAAGELIELIEDETTTTHEEDSP